MKPHEENWHDLNDDPIYRGSVAIGPNTIARFDSNDNAFVDEARAKLAAQAPAMARELIAQFIEDDPYWRDRPEGTVEYRVIKILRAAGVIE